MLHLQKQLRMEVDDTFSWNIIVKKNLIITSTFDISIIVMTTSLNEMFLRSNVLSRLSSLILRCTWKRRLDHEDHDQKDMFVVYCLLTIIISNGNYTNMKQDFYQ